MAILGFTHRAARDSYRGTFDVDREEAEAQAGHADALGLSPTDYRRAALRAFRGAPVESACVPLAAVTTDALQSELERRALPHSSTGTRT